MKRLSQHLCVIYTSPNIRAPIYTKKGTNDDIYTNWNVIQTNTNDKPLRKTSIHQPILICCHYLCCDSRWRGLLWELVLTMTLNTWADGNKKPLLLGLSFANFENDLVRWDVHIKWPLTWRYLQRQAPNTGPHLNQFLSNPIFLWYSMGDTNVDTMGKGWAHLLKMIVCSIQYHLSYYSISAFLNQFPEKCIITELHTGIIPSC